jgi:hypothetical protein
MKKQGIFCGNMLNLSPKMGTKDLFVATHLEQKEHGSWALANTCTTHNV